MAVCSIDGCDSEAKKRGLCDKHYIRAKRNGTLESFTGPGRGRYAPEQSKTCSGVAECGKAELARGFCNSCYQMRRKVGTLDLLPVVNAGKTCKVDGCSTKAQGMGFCGTHYDRFKRYGDPTALAAKITGGACSTKGCSGAVVAKGVCAKCYGNIKKHGDALTRSKWFNKRNEKIIDPKGYVLIYVAKHENANRSSRVQEHRYVMSEFLGRPLRKNENVHHKNGDRADNRLENLELWVTSQPTGQRPIDLMKWAREILKTYAPDENKLKKLEYRNQHQ